VELIKPDVVAPGVDIFSSVPGGYDHKSGTSMSTPHVAGAFALVLQARPSLAADEAMEALRRGSKDLGYPGKDDSFGSGRLDLVRTIQLLQ
jgi:subtilisin family serine protease